MIPLVKPLLTEEERNAVMKVLESGMLAQGKKVKEFEDRFADFCGVNYAIATNSGTSALHSALHSLDIKKGDEVITTPFTFVATANAILMQGATPVFADIEEDTFNLDPKKVEEKITEKTKALLPVDLFGHPYEVASFQKIADKHGLVILEDAAQAIDARYENKKAGSFGDAATFSFYATKNLITGEGGMITTNDEKVAEKARSFRHHGQSQQYEYETLGYNYRMTDILAAIGVEQLKRIKEMTLKRRKNALFLNDELGKIDGITTPSIRKGVDHSFHQYSIVVPSEKRDILVSHLKEEGIGCGIYYPKPVHLSPFFRRMGFKAQLPVSENISRCILSIPVHSHLSEEDLKKIVLAVSSAPWEK